MAVAFVDQVAARASQISFARVLLSLLAAPFYVLGTIVGVLWVTAAWGLAAAQLGVSDARERADRRRGSS